MGLFHNLGLMFHHMGEEMRQGDAELKAAQAAQAKTTTHSTFGKVEEQSPAPGVILRRTIVEEVILAPGIDPATFKQTAAQPASHS